MLLEVHAEAEERLFYPELLRLATGAGSKDSPEAETDDAIHDHNEIRDAIGLVDAEEVGTGSWWKAVAKVREANSDHMGEEERESLADFRCHADLDLRHSLGLSFVVFEAQHAHGVSAQNIDPSRYIERQGGQAT